MSTRGEPGPIEPDVGLVVAFPGGAGYPVVGWTGEPGLSVPVALVDGARTALYGQVVALLHDRAAWDAAWRRHGPRPVR